MRALAARGCAVSIKTFMKQRAVNIAVGGSYTLSNWFDAQGKPRTFACRTSRVSPFRMILEVPVVGRIGDQISAYFSDFGKLEGRISDISNRGFLLELSMDKPTREKMANQLTWVEKKQKDSSIRDARTQARIVPANPHSALTFADGTIHRCFVIDMSVSGAGISASVQPSIGTPLAVGTVVGRVVRHLPDGFAIQFVEPQNRAELDWRITRPAPSRAAEGKKAAPRSYNEKLAAVLREPQPDDDKMVYLEG